MAVVTVGTFELDVVTVVSVEGPLSDAGTFESTATAVGCDEPDEPVDAVEAGLDCGVLDGDGVELMI
jgi:hypothetical protein